MLEISLKKPENSQQHNYAHEILRKNLLNLGIDYKNAVIEKGKYGKPYLKEYPDIHYNISHSNGITACYVGKFEAGIDVEPIREYRPNVVKRAFSCSEQSLIEKSENKNLTFFRLWTLKESYVKAIGIGISYPLKSVEFDFSNGKIISPFNNCVFNQYILGEKYVVSLCRITTANNVTK